MVQRVAQLFGIVFLLIGILGFLSFVGGGMTMEAGANAPKLLGLFPINTLHNIVHILFGVWGLAAARSVSGATTYARVGGIIYIVLAICGFVSPSGFGLVPIGGADIWLHALLGIVLLAVGMQGAKATATATT